MQISTEGVHQFASCDPMKNFTDKGDRIEDFTCYTSGEGRVNPGFEGFLDDEGNSEDHGRFYLCIAGNNTREVGGFFR